MSNDGLAPFTPTTRDWFEVRFPGPTAIQRLAWPRIAAGEHLLVTAPTGTGKTLTGFLWPLDRLLSGGWEAGGLRVLYVSPLKALNADIERNLREPLAGLDAAFRAAGGEPPPVRVGVRSGDSTAAERERIRRRPPEILITTPESLNLLLLSKSAPRLFEGLRLLILDEIHAVVGSKRGTHLMTAVERLTRHAGEFQRVALSATVRPLETVASFVGGRELVRRGAGEARFRARAIGIARAGDEKRYDLRVRALPEVEPPLDRAPDADDAWRRLAHDLAERIREARSTIVFTNSRRTAEKMTRFVNEAARADLAWSHHGSLSRDLRTAVERRLKAGELPAIVATSSLELGIDVGELDRVVLLQTPRSLASAAQRIGRAGHRAGEVSRALFYPTHPRDFVDAAVAVAAVRSGDIEPIRPVRAPLDLLAQTLLAMVATEAWRLDDLFDFVRTADPYRDLSRQRFDLVVEMLAGRYASVRVEELRPRVRIDRVAGTIEGRPGLVPLLARGGGTIPDRGYFRLVVEGSGATLGELDEEFVWERAPGDRFVFGTQAWRVVSIGLHEVTVAPARGGAPLPPFWRADAQDRGAYLSERIGRFLEWADAKVGDPELERTLEREHGFEPEAAKRLAAALEEERRALGVALPHRRHVVVEEIPERGGDEGRRQAIVYTFWGGTVNRPAAIALAALWEESEGTGLEATADDDAILLVLPQGVDARDLLARLDPERIESLLRRRLESGGYFGAHFRRNAQRALLLPRAGPRRRTPLWVSRQNAKKLLDAVAESDDFPLVLETWRTCLVDEFELDVLRERLAELASGEIRVSRVRTERPSPFAANLVWRRTNEQMYGDDSAESRRTSRLREDLLREVALDATARPRISSDLAERYRRTAQRLLPGYAPRDAEELHDWLIERLWIPIAEWEALLRAVAGELGSREAADALVAELGDRVMRLDPGGVAEAVAASETALEVADCPPLEARFAGTATSSGDGDDEGRWLATLGRRLSHWLRFAGPLPVGELARACGLEQGLVERAIGGELREGRLVRGDLTEGAAGGAEVAARSAVETLLRWRRSAARPSRRAVPLGRWPAWLARRQGLIERGSDPEALRCAFERLFGYPAPAVLWETELLPARLDPYLPAWLDALDAETDLGWHGSGPRRATFALDAERELFPAPAPTGEEGRDLSGAEDLEALLRSARGGLELGELVEATGRPSAEVQAALWALAWRGRVACDSVRPLRQAVLAGFRVRPLEPRTDERRTSRRGGFRRWARSRSFEGRWRLLSDREPDGTDPMREEELRRERVRVLAERYGILFRELLARELPELSWGRLARTLRALELGGELVAGSFFEGIPGPQFALPSAIEALDERPPDGAIWWQSAFDPASPCALGLPALDALGLPERRAGNLLVWRGEELLLVARSGGSELEIRAAPGDPVVPALLEPLRVALGRAVAPRSSIELKRIDGEPASASPHLEAFREFALSRTASGVRLRRRYGGS